MQSLRKAFGWTRYLLVWPLVQAYRRRARRSLRWRLAGYNLATLIAGLATALILVGLLAAIAARARNYAEQEPAEDARALADFLVASGSVNPGEPLTNESLGLVPRILSGAVPLYRQPRPAQFDVRPDRYLQGWSSVVVLGEGLPPDGRPRDAAALKVIALAESGSTDLRANSALRPFAGAAGVGAYPIFDSSGAQRGVVVVEKREIQAPQGWALLRAEIRPVVTSVWVGSVVAAIPGLAVAALLAVAAARSVGGRIGDVSGAAEALAAGNLEQRVPVRGEDEVTSLARSFNTMAERLEGAMGSLAAERERAVSLLDANRQLVANVSHELRTPAALIRGQLEALEEEFPGNERAAMAIREVTRLEELVSDLFALAAAEAQAREAGIETFDCAPLLREVTAPVAELARRDAAITLVCEVGDERLPVRGDAQRLAGVIQNLLRNAVRHTPEGGLILLRAAPVGGGVSIEVSDTGPGISQADLPHVFERFYRGDPSRSRETGGTGLGLSLAKEFVQGMGGTIAVSSPPGEGATFVVRLPSP